MACCPGGFPIHLGFLGCGPATAITSTAMTPLRRHLFVRLAAFVGRTPVQKKIQNSLGNAASFFALFDSRNWSALDVPAPVFA